MSKLRRYIDQVRSDLNAWGGATFQNSDNLLKEIEHYMSESIDALEFAEKYFEKCADADCDEDGYIPNEEMRNMVRCQNALKLV